MKVKKKDKSSTAFSSLDWEHFTAIIFMYGQLSTIHKLFGFVISGNEAKRLQFISPILIAVCSLLPDITISVEEDIKGGVYLHANGGRFEYVIKCQFFFKIN
eukprot:gene6362-8762_t